MCVRERERENVCERVLLKKLSTRVIKVTFKKRKLFGECLKLHTFYKSRFFRMC